MDYALGGGWPRGRVNLIWGGKSCSKTTLMLKAVALAQQTDAFTNKYVWERTPEELRDRFDNELLWSCWVRNLEQKRAEKKACDDEVAILKRMHAVNGAAALQAEMTALLPTLRGNLEWFAAACADEVAACQTDMDRLMAATRYARLRAAYVDVEGAYDRDWAVVS